MTVITRGIFMAWSLSGHRTVTGLTESVRNSCWQALCKEKWKGREGSKNKGQVLDLAHVFFWSGKRDSNSRLQPWQDSKTKI